MNRTERSMLHDALAEMVIEYNADPTIERKYALLGARYTVGLLGMPEGHTNYVWPEPGADPADRRIRRLQVIRGAAWRPFRDRRGVDVDDV